jgi:putative phosphoribosyl transferase
MAGTPATGSMGQFENRVSAGRALAKKLEAYANRSDVIVLALPRGGVPVAYEVARALNVPLDVFLVRKLGIPGYEELAMGAIATGGVLVVNEDVVSFLNIPDEVLDYVAAKEDRELERREWLYRGAAKPLNVNGRTVIIVDDGLATGSTMRAAVKALKLGPARIIVAAPVAARDTCQSFKTQVDSTCVCVISPEPFYGVGRWYQDFAQTSDEEVCQLLKEAKKPPRKHGVIYRPETERASHYCQARLSAQFDAVLHFDETRAVEPLERTTEWEIGEVPETFPTGV